MASRARIPVIHAWQSPPLLDLPEPAYNAASTWPKETKRSSSVPQLRSKLFLTLGAAAIVATYSDLRTSQNCEREFSTCREGNGLYPKSFLRADLLESGLSAFAIADSYFLKPHHPNLWSIPVAVVIAAHGAAAIWAVHLRRTIAREH